MKKLFFIFSIIFLLSLAGCGVSDLVNQNSTEKETILVEQTETVTDEPDPQPTEHVDVPATETPQSQTPVNTLSTDYYTLNIPEEWIGKCICDIHERDDGSYTMSVHETNDYLLSGSGTLFTIMMLPTVEDYTVFPSYDLLGVLNTPHGTYNLLVLFPTDVQFTEPNAQNYLAMYNSVQDVLVTLTFVDTPAATVQE